MRRSWPAPGLRSRVTMAFAAGAAAVSGALAGSTYAVAHHYLLAQRQASAEAQTYSDARLVKLDLASEGTNVADVLSFLAPAQGTRSLVYRSGQWYSTSVSVGRSSLPTALLKMVRGGTPAMQRVGVSGSTGLAVGLPLPAVGADYFEIEPLSELVRTLRLLEAVLGGAALVTTVGGVAIGRWASARLVRPLTDVAAVAAAISQGALDQRLPAGNDADLGPLVASFNNMVDALANRIERDARFASDVSHELRSPLTTLQAAVEVLAAFKSNLPSEGRTALALLANETTRFSEMVQDLLELARIDAAAFDLDLEDLPLDEVIIQTVAAYSGGMIPVQTISRRPGHVDSRRPSKAATRHRQPAGQRPQVRRWRGPGFRRLCRWSGHRVHR